VTPASIFPVASVSKALIPIVVMKLVEHKKLDLDDDVSRLAGFTVRNPRHPNAPITLRHLLTHTSGILDTGALSFVEKRGDPTVPAGAFLRQALASDGALFDGADGFARAAPGNRNVYSNIGAGLAAFIAERAAKKSFDALVDDVVFRPLAIDDAGFRRDAIPRGRLVKSYVHDDGHMLPLPLTSWPIYAVGELKISTTSLATIAADLAAGLVRGESRLLTQASWRAMAAFTGARDDGALGQGQTLGLMGLFAGGRKLVGHAGAMAGASAAMFVDQKTGDGAVVLTNGSSVYLGTDKERAAFFEMIAALVGG
jgi:CubicO group peptidase (beta-lactamase class C family)